MSVDSELLIKIRTILDTQGIDAAKSKIEELTRMSSVSSSQSVMDRMTNTKTAKDDLKDIAATTADYTDKLKACVPAVADTRKEMEQATRAAFALRMAANGSTEGFRGLANAAMNMGNSLGALIGRITMVGAAFAAGWKIGTIIREQFEKPLSDAERALGSFKDQAEESSQRWDKALNSIKDKRMDSLKNELDSITESYQKSVSAAEQLLRLNIMLNKSKMERELSELDLEAVKTNMSENEKSEKALNIKRRYEEAGFKTERAALDTVENEETSTLVKNRSALNSLRNKKTAAENPYEAKLADLKDRDLLKFLTPEELKLRSFNSPDLSERLATKQQELEKSVADKEKSAVWLPTSEKIQAFREAEVELKKLKQMREELPRLIRTSEADKMTSAEYTANEKSLQDKIATSESKLQEYKAKRDDLAMREETAGTKDTAARAELRRKWNEDEDARNPDPKKIARKAYGDIVGSMSLRDDTPRDNAGQPLSVKGQEAHDQQRMASAVAAVQDAGRQIYGGANVDEVTRQLAETLNQLGVKMGGYVDNMKTLKDAVERLDGIVGGMRSEVLNLKSQSSVAQGLN